MNRAVRVSGCTAWRRGIWLRLALTASFLVVLVVPTSAENPFDSPRNVVGYDRSSSGYKAVVGNDGLVYLLWKSGQLQCATDIHTYSDAMHITALSSGYEAWEDEIGFDFGTTGELFFVTGLGADIDTASTWDNLYVAWAGRDDCDQTFRQIRYGKIKAYKDPSPGIAITSQDTVSSKVWRCKGPEVAIDKDRSLHFSWTDQRCDQITGPGKKHFGMPFYRKRTASGTWRNTGRQCRRSPWVDTTWTDTTKTWADSAWSDNASVVTFEMQGGQAGTDSCVCCPRDFGCHVDSCEWWQGQVFEILDDSGGRVHFVWHDTFCHGVGDPEHSADNTMHRSISGSEIWEDTTTVSTGTHNFIGGSACLISGDTLVVFYRDYYDPDFGLWYRFKGQGAFSDPGLAWEDTVRAGYPPGANSQVRVASDGDSTIHMLYGATDHAIKCYEPPPPGDILPMDASVPETTYVSALFHRQGVFDHANAEIDWDPKYGSDSQGDQITTVDDTTRTQMGEIVCDACGRVHVFYTRAVTSEPCSSAVRSRIHHLVTRDTTSICSIMFPAGGEDWCVSDTHTIRWKLCPRTDGKVTKQSIHVKRSAGVWSTIADSVPPLTRAYDWRAGQPASNGCKIMVVAHMDRWDDNDSSWVAADPCSCISNNFNIKQCGGPACPHLYAWRAGAFDVENSILRRQYRQSTPVDDYLVLEDMQPDNTGLLQLKIVNLDPDTSYIWGAAATPMCTGEHLLVSMDGALFKPGPATAPVKATEGGQDVLQKILEIDGDLLWGSDGTTATVTLPGITGTEAVLVMQVGDKPPTQPWSQADGQEPGLHLTLDDDALFVTGAGQASSVTIQPRQFLSTVAIRVVRHVQTETLELKLTWCSDHPIDYIGLYPAAEEFLPEGEPMEPTAVKFIGADTQASQDGFPYRLAPGDELRLAYESRACAGGDAGSYLLWFKGYYVGPSASAGVRDRLALAMWLTSPVPCNGPRLAGRISIPQHLDASLDAYDIQGRLLRCIMKGHLEAGIHSFEWDLRSDSGGRVAPGLYFLRFRTPERTIVKKIIVER